MVLLVQLLTPQRLLVHLMILNHLLKADSFIFRRHLLNPSHIYCVFLSIVAVLGQELAEVGELRGGAVLLRELIVVARLVGSRQVIGGGSFEPRGAAVLVEVDGGLLQMLGLESEIAGNHLAL